MACHIRYIKKLIVKLETMEQYFQIIGSWVITQVKVKVKKNDQYLEITIQAFKAFFSPSEWEGKYELSLWKLPISSFSF